MNEAKTVAYDDRHRHSMRERLNNTFHLALNMIHAQVRIEVASVKNYV